MITFSKKRLLLIVFVAFPVYLIIEILIIPSSVKIKYDELATIYGKSVGVRMAYCKSGGKIIYSVSGNGGYTGITYFYNGKGEELGTESFSDIDLNFPPFTTTHPPVIVEHKSCIPVASYLVKSLYLFLFALITR